MPNPETLAPSRPTDWPKISDYALIGDCKTAALIGLDGGIDWWCLPNFSGPTFFARLLDRERGGRFTINPVNPHTGAHRYVGETNVLETTFTVDGEKNAAELRLTDAMILPTSLPAAQLLPQHELLRCIEAVESDVAIEVVYEPRPDYGRAKVRLTPCGRWGWACAYRDHLLLLHTDLPLELSEDKSALSGTYPLQNGERKFLSITYVKNDIGVTLPLGHSAAARLKATTDWWKYWSSHCTYYGPYRTAVVRSALVTKLLDYCLSGAIIAAPTSSLPETVGGARNWDYRYCWLRDASLILDALMDIGYQAEADTFLDWLLHSTNLTWPKLQVLYDLYGEAQIPESTLDHLSGYRHSQPVRIGNAAWNQRQLDVYGVVIKAAVSYLSRGGKISHDSCKMLAGFGKTVIKEWRRTDYGIWEIRGESRHHTHSKVMCWAALDGLLELAERGLISIPREHYRHEREAIRRTIEAEGFNQELNSYTATFDSKMSDASLLLLPRFDYLDAADPRMAGTLAYHDAQLASGALMHRYQSGFDGLEGDEHPFGICSFWAVDALARAGRIDEAKRRFEELLGFANHVGLYGEEIHSKTGEAMGNFPQAFTHVGLINAAVSLESAAKRARRGKRKKHEPH